jgi:hypothetical protein
MSRQEVYENFFLGLNQFIKSGLAYGVALSIEKGEEPPLGIEIILRGSWYIAPAGRKFHSGIFCRYLKNSTVKEKVNLAFLTSPKIIMLKEFGFLSLNDRTWRTGNRYVFSCCYSCFEIHPVYAALINTQQQLFNVEKFAI